MNRAQDVIDADLERIRSSLKSEFASMADKRLLSWVQPVPGLFLCSPFCTGIAL